MLTLEQADKTLESESGFALLTPECELILSSDKTANNSALDSYFELNNFFFDLPLSGIWSQFSKNKQAIIAGTVDLNTSQQKLAIAPETLASTSQSKDSWLQYCAKIDQQLATGNLNKVVPARMKSWNIANSIHNISHIFSTLCSHTDNLTYRFAIKAGGSLFLGATPELLFKRKEGTIFIPAIAGTAFVESENSLDATELRLLHSEKDNNEHAFVIEGILQALKNLGIEQVTIGKTITKRSGKLLHLYTPLEAKDPGPVLTGQNLMQALHPTPAIGGTPKQQSLDFLAMNEPFQRGLFSAPIYVQINKHYQICLVAIRSALIENQTLHVFAGAGYVKGSSAESEWIETSNKMRSILNIFNGVSHGLE